MELVESAGIKIPNAYKMGFSNNNCLMTGCVQGGIGYWQKIKIEFPDRFEKMAELEHELTNEKGEQVTMLKDQSIEGLKKVEKSGLKWANLVFLKKHKDYPDIKCLDDMQKHKIEPLVDCNGFCGTNDLNPIIQTTLEINFNN